MQPSKPTRNQLQDAWRIAGAYWRSEEKWSAWGLLVAIVLLSLTNVYVSVRINEWNKSFYNALQAFDRGEVIRQLVVFCGLALLAATISVNALFLNQNAADTLAPLANTSLCQ
jgi:vitamin B12/bleomycin/antimicrobial peptide transport system ATP-binding/permease protein